MALLKVEAEKLSNNDLVSGVIEEIITREEVFALLPFVGVNGKAYVYNRENVLATATWLDPNDTVTESATTFTQITTVVKILAGDVDVDKFLQAADSDHNDQKAIQIAKKAKALSREFKRTLAKGDATGNPKEFDGIDKLTAAGQTISAATNGAAMTLSMLDQLRDLVPNGPDCFMMRSGTIRAYLALLRAAGGTMPEQIMVENFGNVLGHNGVPIVRNDWLANDETFGSGTALCSIYAVRMNEVDGLHGLYAGPNAGIVVEDIGTVQNKDATRTRLKWYAGLALKSTQSLARLKAVTNI